VTGAAWTWMAFFALLLLMGARAWVVETSTGRAEGRGTGRQKALTASVAGMLAVLIVLAVFNGGATLVSMLLNGGKVPADTTVVTDNGAAPAAPAPPAN
jgi:hypothetical protein